MIHRIAALATTVTAALIALAACGEAPLESGSDETAAVLLVFGAIELEESESILFRVDLRDGGKVAGGFSYIPTPGQEPFLPDRSGLRVERFIDARPDSLSFAVVDGEETVLKVGSRWSQDPETGQVILFGSAVQASGEVSYPWVGAPCFRLLDSQTPVDERFFTLEDVAHPIVYELPAYPESLSSYGVEGTVVTEVLIGACGRVLGQEIVSTAHGDLVDSVTASVSSWEFYPAILQGRPAFYAAYQQRLTFQFYMDGDFRPQVEMSGG